MVGEHGGLMVVSVYRPYVLKSIGEHLPQICS